MKTCKNCGFECPDDKEICPNCGALIDNHVTNKEYMRVYHSESKKVREKKHIWFFLLGFILPGIGIIAAYFLVEDRAKSKAMVTGAIISTIISILVPIIITIVNQFI